MADNDDLFDEGTGSDDASGSGDGTQDPPAPQGDGSDGGASGSSTDDRVAFWMSKAQSAEAEVNRLKGVRQDGTPKDKPGPKSSGDQQPPAGQPDRLTEFTNFARENVRNQLFSEEPRLKEFGFSLDDIAGDSLAEMQANRQRLVKVIEKAESRALNQAFEKVGIDPSLAGGPTERKDYSAMSDEEFEKEIARAKGLNPIGF